jgi:DinB superfamily
MDATRNERDERNAASLARLREFTGRLSDEELVRPLGNGWTAAAEIAHLAFWDRRALILLDKWARDGISPSGMDVDVINDALLPQWLLLPPREAVTDALAAGEAINAKIAALSDDLAAGLKEGQVIRLDRSRHRTDHLDALERTFS